MRAVNRRHYLFHPCDLYLFIYLMFLCFVLVLHCKGAFLTHYSLLYFVINESLLKYVNTELQCLELRKPDHRL